MTIFSGNFWNDFFWFIFNVSIFGGGAICFGVALWSTSTMRTLSSPATEIFRMFGFANRERVNLNMYQYGITHLKALIHSSDSEANYSNIHDYRKAVKDGKITMSSPVTAEAGARV